MKLKIKVKSDDAAATENPFKCAVEVLQDAIKKIEAVNVHPGPYEVDAALLDRNGNTVGRIKFDAEIDDDDKGEEGKEKTESRRSTVVRTLLGED